jgi:hypothetical protein
VSRAGVTWENAPRPLRVLAAWLTAVQLVGYTTSLVFVWWTTRLVPAGIAGHYRGSDPSATEGAMQFAKSFAEMLTITHTHLLGMAVIFAVTGACVALCGSLPERARRLLIAEPFAALLISFGAMWLMRYADPRFAWLLEASSLVMAVTFYLQSALVLRELHRTREARSP